MAVIMFIYFSSSSCFNANDADHGPC